MLDWRDEAWEAHCEEGLRDYYEYQDAVQRSIAESLGIPSNLVNQSTTCRVQKGNQARVNWQKEGF